MTEQEQRIPKRDDPGKGPQGIAPDLEARTVIGIFDRVEDAEGALNDLRAAGFADADIARIHAPIGADIDAKSPAEIALAILAQIKK